MVLPHMTARVGTEIMNGAAIGRGGEPPGGRIYLAYGLRIRSALPLPAPAADDRQPDVELRTGALPYTPAVVDPADYWFQVVDGDVVICSGGVATALLREGELVVVDPCPGVDDSLLQSFILGPVFAFLLYQRSFLVLHASAIEIGGKAIAFVGAPGAGKSTLAAALYARGHRVIADDLVAVQMERAGPVVPPGLPLLRLCRDAWDRYVGAAWDPVAADEDKSVWPAARGFRPDRLPLQRAYLLEEGDRDAIGPVCAPHAVVALARNTFAGRRPVEAARAHLRQCEALARSGVTRRLCQRRASLVGIVPLIEDDVAESN